VTYAPPVEGRATWSLVLGVGSVVLLCGCPPGSLITGLAGLVLAVGSRRSIARSQGALNGDGVAFAGVITSVIGGGTGALAILVFAGYVLLYGWGIMNAVLNQPSPTPVP
jgi:hypothetical protein